MANRLGSLSNSKLALFISVCYVASASIYLLLEDTTSSWVGLLLYFLFFPALVFPNLILLVQKDPAIYLLICQAITCLIFWGVLSLVLMIYRRNS